MAPPITTAVPRPARALRVTLAVGVCTALTMWSVPAAFATEPACGPPRPTPLTPGPRVAPPVTLESSGAADPMNMGGLRGTGMTDITVSASPALPGSVTPAQITIDVPKRIARNEAGLSAAYLPTPTFSEPRILAHGKLIAFTMCVDASHASAGSYVGQIIVGGPEGVQAATVTVTLKAKDRELFTVGIILAALLAFVLLAVRSIRAHYDKLEGPAKTPGKSIAAAVGDLFGFWLPTVVAIGGAVVAMFQVYDANVAWGADTGASLIALGGTAISAAGLGTFLSSFRGP